MRYTNDIFVLRKSRFQSYFKSVNSFSAEYTTGGKTNFDKKILYTMNQIRFSLLVFKLSTPNLRKRYLKQLRKINNY